MKYTDSEGLSGYIIVNLLICLMNLKDFRYSYWLAKEVLLKN